MSGGFGHTGIILIKEPLPRQRSAGAPPIFRPHSRIAGFPGSRSSDFPGDVVEQFERVIGFREKMVHAEAGEFLFMVMKHRGATDHQSLFLADRLDSPADLNPGKAGQIQVHENQVKRTSLKVSLHPFWTVGRLLDGIALPLEELRNQATEPLLVLDQQEVTLVPSFHAGLLAGRVRGIGDRESNGPVRLFVAS